MTDEAPKQAEGTDQAQATGSAASAKPKRERIPRPYPSLHLEKALQIALAIKENNAGNPWPPGQVAKAIGIGEKSSSLDFATRASQMYGLTSGTRAATYISLETIGREIVYAPGAEAELAARRRAFLNVDIFSKVLEYYKGNQLPELDFLSNTLSSEFGLPKAWHEEFRSIFLANCAFAAIGPSWDGPSEVSRSGSNSVVTTESPVVKSFAAESNTEGKRCFVIMPSPSVDLTGRTASLTRYSTA